MFGSITKVSERIKLEGVKGIGSLSLGKGASSEKKDDVAQKQPRRT